MMTCSCEFDTAGSQVTLDLPDGICRSRKCRKVSVDRCMAPVIRHLWENGIETLSSCCGHNDSKGNPSLVIADGYGKEDYVKISGLIGQKDGREWDLMQWQVTVVGK